MKMFVDFIRENDEPVFHAYFANDVKFFGGENFPKGIVTMRVSHMSLTLTIIKVRCVQNLA